MQEFHTVIKNPTGLHARPAKLFVNTAKQYKSTVKVQHGSKTANAKSLISMLTLGAERGSEIVVRVEGEDEAEAYRALRELIDSGLGEGELMAELVEKEGATTVPAEPGPEPEQARAQPQPTIAPVSDNVTRGVAASPGIAIGPIFRFQRGELAVDATFTSVTEEEVKLLAAVREAQAELGVLYQQMQADGSTSESAIFEVHQELVQDPELQEAVFARIRAGVSAGQAWQQTIEERATQLAALADPLLAARAADIRDVGYRVLRLIVGAKDQDVILPDHAVIIVAHDLAPSDTASLDRRKVLGFCTAAGGPTAHTAIIARSLSIPAVVSAGSAVLKLNNGTQAILDGDAGTLTLEPDAETLALAQALHQKQQARREAALRTAAQPAVSQDGHRVEVVANVGGLKDAQLSMSLGAEGIGLLRTEFLYLERSTAPDEEEQFKTYQAIVQAMDGQPVIVRTLDIGGDKPLPYIDVAPEENPFLGERGIRLCLNRPDLLRQQLRAILRAASDGTIRIMFPMVADINEWRDARALVEEVRADLNAPTVDLGIMVEVPSAALMADAFAREVDFFSIGTNDLTQYTLAMDRMHPALAGKSDGLHPAVLRLIDRTVQAAHQAGKWVGICGELGSDPQAVPILVGLGVDELSVNPPAVPLVKAQIRELTLAEAQTLAEQAKTCATSAEVRALIPA